MRRTTSAPVGVELPVSVEGLDALQNSAFSSVMLELGALALWVGVFIALVSWLDMRYLAKNEDLVTESERAIAVFEERLNSLEKEHEEEMKKLSEAQTNLSYQRLFFCSYAAVVSVGVLITPAIRTTLSDAVKQLIEAFDVVAGILKK